MTPVLMCGGDEDPTVFFSVNTLVMQQYWAALPAGLITVVDINAPVTDPADPFAAAKGRLPADHRRHRGQQRRCRRGAGHPCHRGTVLYRRGAGVLRAARGYDMSTIFSSTVARLAVGLGFAAGLGSGVAHADSKLGRRRQSQHGCAGGLRGQFPYPCG